MNEQAHEEYAGKRCQRQPAGRIATIKKVGPRGYLIDEILWCGWVTPKTFRAKWMIEAEPNKTLEPQPEQAQS